LRLSSFGGYGLAFAALALVVFGAYDSFPKGRAQGNKTQPQKCREYLKNILCNLGDSRGTALGDISF